VGFAILSPGVSRDDQPSGCTTDAPGPRLVRRQIAEDAAYGAPRGAGASSDRCVSTSPEPTGQNPGNRSAISARHPPRFGGRKKRTNTGEPSRPHKDRGRFRTLSPLSYANLHRRPRAGGTHNPIPLITKLSQVHGVWVPSIAREDGRSPLSAG